MCSALINIRHMSASKKKAVTGIEPYACMYLFGTQLWFNWYVKLATPFLISLFYMNSISSSPNDKAAFSSFPYTFLLKPLALCCSLLPLLNSESQIFQTVCPQAAPSPYNSHPAVHCTMLPHQLPQHCQAHSTILFSAQWALGFLLISAGHT